MSTALIPAQSAEIQALAEQLSGRSGLEVSFKAQIQQRFQIRKGETCVRGLGCPDLKGARKHSGLQ